MTESVWPHEVKRKGEKVTMVVMTNGMVAVSFVRRRRRTDGGGIVELLSHRTRLDRAITCGPERFLMPPAHYKRACRIAAAILHKSEG